MLIATVFSVWSGCAVFAIVSGLTGAYYWGIVVGIVITILIFPRARRLDRILRT